MNKSDPNGGGRGSSNSGRSIIGDVINHGKLPLWSPRASVHYHATLSRGENTLEAQLVRVLMKTVAREGSFSAVAFREAYVEFMMTPGSHNDAYASTCHRMFFANLERGMDPEDCPDNDAHNVDTIDGLVLPTVAALAAKGKEEARAWAAEVAKVTRKSHVLESAGDIWGGVVYEITRGSNPREVLDGAARAFGGRKVRCDGRDEMSACYLQQSFPPALNMACKYGRESGDGAKAWEGLVANANVGGENVHRGAILGAFLGARAGVENLPKEMIDGLYDAKDLEKEIDAFIEVVLRD